MTQIKSVKFSKNLCYLCSILSICKQINYTQTFFDSHVSFFSIQNLTIISGR